MTDDPLNSIAEMPDIPMSLGMSQGSSQGSQPPHQGAASSSQGRRSSRRASKAKKKGGDTKGASAEGTVKASATVGGVSRVTPAKTRRGKENTKADEEQKETPAKVVPSASADVSMQPGAAPSEGAGAKRKAVAESETVAKKPKTPAKQEGAC